MEPAIEQLRKNYEQFDNEKLVRLATEEANRLRPEALELLKQIIKDRGLSEDIDRSIDAQFQEIDETLLKEYCELIRNQPCPICNSTQQKLNATITGKVVSVILMTNYEKELKIACPDCLDKQNNDAMIKSALLGWWGFPEGAIRTIQSLIFNNKMKKQNRFIEANDSLKGFVLKRIGRIEVNRNNQSELQSIIKYIR